MVNAILAAIAAVTAQIAQVLALPDSPYKAAILKSLYAILNRLLALL